MEPTFQPTQLKPTKNPTKSPTLQPSCAESRGNFNLCVALDMSGSVCYRAIGGPCEACYPATRSCNSGGKKLNICCPNFANMLDFTRSLIAALGELPTDYDVSIVQFSTNATVVSKLENTRKSIKTINKLKYTGGQTNLAGAISSCQSTLDESPPDRENIMLIITDGRPNVGTESKSAEGAATAAALNANTRDTFIIPVMIEQPNSNRQRAVSFLTNNISSDGKVFVSDFNGLVDLQDSIFEQVTCQANDNSE